MGKQLSEPFTPDDTFTFGPRSGLDLDHDQMVAHSKESLSFDGVYYALLLLSFCLTLNQFKIVRQ